MDNNNQENTNNGEKEFNAKVEAGPENIQECPHCGEDVDIGHKPAFMQRRMDAHLARCVCLPLIPSNQCEEKAIEPENLLKDSTFRIFKASDLEDGSLEPKNAKPIATIEHEIEEDKNKATSSTSSTSKHSKGEIASQSPSDAENSSEIESIKILKHCTYFAKGSCKNGTSCKYEHSIVDKKELEKQKFEAICKAMEKQVNSMKIKMKDLLNAADSLDLVLVMDCTGSMSSWIESAKQHLCSMVDDVRKAPGNANLKIRVGFVAYRDHSDGDDRIVATPLTTDIQQVKSVIMSQRAFGGDDCPEDVVGGLKASLEMDWKAGARLVVLVCDAPCHFPKYNSGGDSTRHLAAAKKLYQSSTYIETVVQRMATAGIDLVTIEIMPQSTNKMTRILRQVFNSAPRPADGIARKFSSMLMENGHADSIKLGSLVTDVARLSVSESKLRVERSITAISTARVPSISSSARASSTADAAVAVAVDVAGVGSSSGKRASFAKLRADKLSRLARVLEVCADGPDEEEEREEESVKDKEHQRVSIAQPALVKAPLDWDRVMQLTPQRARRFTYILRPGETIDWTNPELRLVSQSTDIYLDNCYFSEGAMRTAHLMYDNLLNTRLVAKVYKKRHSSAKATLSTIQQDVQAQAVAKILAKEYSLHSEVPQAVDFIVTSYYELVDRDESDPFKYISAEPFIDGDYRKYNNNSGWASADFGDTAQAFSHFSWDYTSAALMVVDLQGVNYILTDPQIHTRRITNNAATGENRFGLGNLGTDGMIRFFCTHQCNDICNRLNLRAFSSAPASLPKASTTTCLPCTAASTYSAADSNEEEEEDQSNHTINEYKLSLSCQLCGNIFQCPRKAISSDRHSYCPCCTMNIKTNRVTTKCICEADIEYSPHWYRMIGMEAPRTCITCRAKKIVSKAKKGA